MPKRIVLFPLLVVLLAWALAGTVIAGSVSLPDDAAAAADRQAAFDRLEEKVGAGGELPVIVRLRTGDLPAPADLGEHRRDPARAQRKLRVRADLIKQAQDRVTGALAGRPARLGHYRYLPLAALRAGPEELELLRALPEVLSITEDRPHPLVLNRSVPHIGGDLAYNQGYTGAGQTVVIIDTGVQTTHPAFTGRVLHDYEACFSGSGLGNGSGVASTTSLCPAVPACPGNYSFPDNTACGPGAGFYCAVGGVCWHGTHVAGIAAGNHSTYRGVAPGANLIPIQVFVTENNSLVAYDSDIIAGLDYVLALSQTHPELKIAAINMSLGGDVYTSTHECDTESAPTKAAIDALRSAGIATVIAAGNNGNKTALSAPGCISTAVSVGSTDTSDSISGFSNLTAALSLFAPGSSIYSSVPTDAIGGASGTSMATPHVTGAFALLRQRSAAQLLNPAVDNLLAALRLAGVPIGNSVNPYTTPRLQVDQALALIDATRSLPVELIMDSELAPTGITTLSGTFSSVDSTAAYGGSVLRGADSSQANAIRFTPGLPTAGYYRVSLWWPVLAGNTAAAHVDLQHADGVDTFIVDQTTSGAQWNDLGNYRFAADGSAHLSVSGESGMPVVADAVRFEFIGTTPPVPRIESPAWLALAEVAVPYRERLLAAGGVGALQWSIAGGILPPGLELDPETGEISGTPTQAGSFPVNIQLTDALAQTASLATTIVVAPAGGRINVAAQSHGGVAGASSSYAGLPASGANDGTRRAGWTGSVNSGMWMDATSGVFPDWLQVTFAGTRTIQEIDVFTQQDNYKATSEPTLDMTFGLYGITTFEVQYWTGSGWSTVPGGSVTGNHRVWRRFSFAPVTTTAVRVLVNGSAANTSRIVEFEAWTATAVANGAPTVSLSAPAAGQGFTAPATVTVTATAADADGTIARVEFYADTTLIATATTAPYTVTWNTVPAGNYVLTAKAYDNAGAATVSDPRSITVVAASTLVNVAAAANGGVASASSSYAGLPASGANDGTRRAGWTGTLSSGMWMDATSGAFPDWLQVTFAGSQTIQQIDVFTQQDNYKATSEPTLDMTFSLYGIKAFDVQYWTGSGWSTVPGGSVTGNNRVWRRLSFAPVTTTAVRVLVNGSTAGTSRIVELEAWTAGTAANVAPTVSLSAPAAGQGFTAPAAVTLTATAADADGSIARVEFYADTTLIGTATTAPYTSTWNDVPAGTYVLTAKAYDNAGAATVSDPRSIVVVAAVTALIIIPAARLSICRSPFRATLGSTDA